MSEHEETRIGHHPSGERAVGCGLRSAAGV